MNEALLFIEIIITFSLLLLIKRYFGKYGVISWVGVAFIVANIEVAKMADIFSIHSTLGSVMFASTFLATDILSECYGKKYALMATKAGMMFTVVYIIAMQISLLYTPNELDTVHSSMQTIFAVSPRICFSSIAVATIANYIDVVLYDLLKVKYSNGRLWLRNNICTITCNCLENFLFCFCAFWNMNNTYDVILISISSSIIEIIVALCDTPFLYLAKYKIKDKEEM